MNNYFEFYAFGYDVRLKHVSELWYSERRGINCKIYLFFNIALVVRRRT